MRDKIYRKGVDNVFHLRYNVVICFLEVVKVRINSDKVSEIEKYKIYIVLSNNHTVVGNIVSIREKIQFGLHDRGAVYSHASISLDRELHNMMSFARKKIKNPFVAGLIKEDISSGLFISKPQKNKIAVICINVSEEIFNSIQNQMNRYWERRDEYKYDINALIRVLLRGREKTKYKNENRFFCSQWVNALLKECGLNLFKNNRYYTISPSDFYHELKDKIIYEGLTKEYFNYAGSGNTPCFL